MNDVAGSQIFFRSLVLGIRETPNQLFIEVTHGSGGYVHIELLEELDNCVNLLAFRQAFADTIKFKVIEDVSNVLGKAVFVCNKVFLGMSLTKV